MSGERYAARFQELLVWQRSRELAREVFVASKTFPKAETFSLTDQVRRSSSSVGAQIAEAWAKRRYPRHFVSKLTDANGEQMETQHWLILAFDRAYLTREQTETLGATCKEIGAMLSTMITRADDFCQSPANLREDPPDGTDGEGIIPPGRANE